MSPNWDVTDIKMNVWVYKNAKKTNRLLESTHKVTLLTVTVGMSQITQKNWFEFFARVRAYELLCDRWWDNCTLVAPRDIRTHIGLKTNAATLTKIQFYKDLSEKFEREISNHYKEKI